MPEERFRNVFRQGILAIQSFRQYTDPLMQMLVCDSYSLVQYAVPHGIDGGNKHRSRAEHDGGVVHPEPLMIEGLE